MRNGKIKLDCSLKLPLLLIAIFLILPLNTYALEYNQEVIKTDLTSFSWKFNPNLEKDFYSENFNVYVDNLGCELYDTKLYAIIPIEYTQTDYWNETNCLIKDNKTAPLVNGTWQKYNDCQTTLKSKSYNVKTEEKIDLSLTDVYFTKDMFFEYEGKRRAKTGYQACDMNFKIDLNNDGILEYDVKDDGKAWWNLTFNKKYFIEFPVVNHPPVEPLRIEFNNSVINMSDCQSDGGDVRFTNEAEDTELEYYIQSWNETKGFAYVNLTASSSNQNFYMYCNSSTPLNTTGNNNIYVNNNNIIAMYDFDDTTGALLDKASNNDIPEVGTVPSQSGILNLSRGVYSLANYFADSNFVTVSESNDYTISTWFYVSKTVDSEQSLGAIGGGSVNQLMLFLNYDSASGKFQMCKNKVGAAFDCAQFTQSLSVGNWYHVVGTYTDSPFNLSVWVDGVIGTDDTAESTGGATNSNNVYIGVQNRTAIAQQTDDGYLDDISIFQRKVSQNEINALFVNGRANTYPYYASGEYNITEIIQAVQTNLSSGLLDENYNLISPLQVDEEQLFWIVTNYTYSQNSSVIDDTNAICEYSADGMQDITYQSTGNNVSICLGGSCDFTQRTVTVTHNTTGFINNEFKFDVCHSGTVKRDFVVNTSCGASYTLTGTDYPFCSGGSLNVSIFDANCSTTPSFDLTLRSLGTGTTQALRLVNNFSRVDLKRNQTESMIFNTSLNQWIADELHMYEQSGLNNISVSCNYTGGGVENKTDIIEVTALNLPPVIIIDSIWWWLLGSPTNFVNNTIARYPLQSSINISTEISDLNLDTSIFYLNYSNGTNINTYSNGVNIDLNYTSGNFSTNQNYLSGANGYSFTVYANDTQGLESILTRHFTAQNSEPVLVFDESSPQIVSSLPYNLTWTCSDFESETLENQVYINSTLNKSGTDQYYEFNFNQSGDYIVSVYCADSFYNVTENFTISFREGCITSYSGILDGSKYPELNKNIGLSCSNINLTECYYKIEDFAQIQPSNCADFNISLLRGWNNIEFTFVTAGINTTEKVNVWAVNPNDSILNYPYIIIIIGVIVLMGILGRTTRAGMFDAMNLILFPILGFNLMAFSFILGITAASVGVLATVMLIVSKM